MRIHTKIQYPPRLADKIMNWIWNWDKPLCKDCKDTGKILQSPTGSDEDVEEGFCSCLKGREKLNREYAQLYYRHRAKW